VVLRIGIVVVMFAALGLLPGCGAREQDAGISSLDPSKLPALPAQGLVVDGPRGVLLERLDGNVVGRLSGFRRASCARGAAKAGRVRRRRASH
jgi:hypothetical protein